MEKDEILRKAKPLIEDRIDLRHRIMDTLIESGMKLQHGHLAKSIDKIDEIVWVDGDMRTTRLRYDLFTTFRRKGIDFDEEGATKLFEATADTLLARGTGLEFDELDPDYVDNAGGVALAEAMQMQAVINERLTTLLEHIDQGMMVRHGPMASGMSDAALTQPSPAANQKTEQPSRSGTPGGKGKPKS